MYGFVVVGGLAAVWGVLVAVLDQPWVQDKKRVERWCAALLVASAGVVGTAALGAATSLY
jgi:hypothetical protein